MGWVGSKWELCVGQTHDHEQEKLCRCGSHKIKKVALLLIETASFCHWIGVNISLRATDTHTESSCFWFRATTRGQKQGLGLEQEKQIVVLITIFLFRREKNELFYSIHHISPTYNLNKKLTKIDAKIDGKT